MEGPDVLQSRLRFSEGKLEEEQHLNTQLQQDYDELSKKLAAAELTIDRLRLGVNTRVHKTLVYELKEQERQRLPSQSGAEDAIEGDGPHGENGGVPENGLGASPPQNAEDPANSFSDHSRGHSVSSVSQSLFSPGRPGSLDSQHLALILLCQSLQDDIDALLHRLEQTPAHERLGDAPAVRTEFAGLQCRFGELEAGMEHLRQARHHQPLAVNASQPLEDEMAVLREMMEALEATLHPERFSVPRTQLSSSRSEEAALPPVDRAVSPISIDSLAGVPSIGEDCDDLSQYGRSLSHDGSPATSPLATTPQPHYDHDIIHSSPLSSSSSLQQSAAPKPASSVSRRRVWQSSSDSENASLLSRSSRKPPSLPVRSDSLVSLQSQAPRAVSPAIEPMLVLPAAHPYADPYAPASPVSHGSSSSATHTFLPAAQQQQPPPAAAAPPHALRQSPWLNGGAAAAANGHSPLPLQPTAHYPPSHLNGTAPGLPERTSSALRCPPGSVGERDSGYTGSERQAVTVRRNPVASGPVRSSTGSELLPIASHSSSSSSSCPDADQHPMSSSTSCLGRYVAADGAASKPVVPERLGVTATFPRSKSTGSGFGVPASPSANSTIVSLRADLARLRQQLLDDSALQPTPQLLSPHHAAASTTTTTNMAAATTPPATPTSRVRLPASLSRSPVASEAALRNLLDTVVRNPSSSRATSPTLSSSGGGLSATPQRAAAPLLARSGLRAASSSSRSGQSRTMTSGSASAPSPEVPRRRQPRVQSQSTLSNGFTSSSSSSSSAGNGILLPVRPQMYDAAIQARSLSSSSAHSQLDSRPALVHVAQLSTGGGAAAAPRPHRVSSTQTPLRDLPARRRYDDISPVHDRRWQQPAARSTPYLAPGQDAGVPTQRHRYHVPPHAATATDAFSQSGPPPVADAYSQTAASRQQYRLPAAPAFAVTDDTRTQTSLRDSHTQTSLHTAPHEKSVSWRSAGAAAPPEHLRYGEPQHGYDDDGARYVYDEVPSPVLHRALSGTPTQTEASRMAQHRTYSLPPAQQHRTYSLPPAQQHRHRVPVAYAAARPVHVEPEPLPPAAVPMMSSYGGVYSTPPPQQRGHRTAVPMSSTPVQYVYADAAPVQYLDELNLTEANRQAAQLRRQSEGMVRSLEDSLSYHSFLA